MASFSVLSTLHSPSSAWSQTKFITEIAQVPPFPARPLDPNRPIPPSSPSPPPQPILPEEQPSPSPDSTPSAPSADRFLIKSIKILGATVLQDEISKLVAAHENQQLTLGQLLDLRTAITQLYIQNGYATSGAFIPSNQDLNDGNVRIQVVEGKLEDIQITGTQRLQKSYIRSRIKPYADAPLNRSSLETALQLLQLNPLIKSIQADLTQGSAPGLSKLIIDIDRAPAFHIGASFDNYRSPSIGSLQGSLNIAHDNVLGFGDRFTGTYNMTDGLNLFSLGYTFPINARDGTLGISYSNVESEIVTEELQAFNISSDFENFSFELRQPLIKTPRQEFTLGVGFDLRQSQSFLDGTPFPFSIGVDDDGQAKTRVLRFTQEWTNRQANNVLSLRSQFNIGLNVFDATTNPTGPSAGFFSWLGQAQYVRRIPYRGLLITRLSTQLTPDSLLSLEQLGIGGINTVRGYARNQILTDNGILGSVEARFPLTKNPNTLQISPFIEAGHGWNIDGLDPNPSTLVGLGLGLRWQPRPDLSLRLDYGAPLVPIADQGDSLQEQGIYFSLRYQPL